MGALLELSVQSCNEQIIWDFCPLLVLSCYLNPPAIETQRQLLLLLGTFTRCRGLWGYVLIVCCGFLPDSPSWVLLLTERLGGIAAGIPCLFMLSEGFMNPDQAQVFVISAVMEAGRSLVGAHTTCRMTSVLERHHDISLLQPSTTADYRCIWGLCRYFVEYPFPWKIFWMLPGSGYLNFVLSLFSFSVFSKFKKIKNICEKSIANIRF